VATGHYLNIDQNQPNADVNMALFGQGDLAQSFKPQNSIINGAGIFLLPGYGGNSTVTISLWTNLPNNGGIMLASGSAPGIPGNWVDVSGNVSVTPGTTYYLVFQSTDIQIRLVDIMTYIRMVKFMPIMDMVHIHLMIMLSERFSRVVVRQHQLILRLQSIQHQML
jgi:hypothetical protein